MKNISLLIILGILLPLFSYGDIYDDRLKICKGDANEVNCSSMVLLDAIRDFKPSSASSQKPMCNCACNGINNVYTCNLYYIDGENSQTLANGLTPRECVDALRYPPCRN